MKNYELKLPAGCAAIEEDEMTYLVGGTAIEDTDAWQTILTVGQVFNYIARVFSASSSIINNFNTIFTSFTMLGTLFSKLAGNSTDE